MENIKNIIIIASLLDSKNSYYTRKQRYEQTKKTIFTVRDKIPDSYIIFADITKLDDEENEFFSKHCNLVLNEYENNELIQKVNSGKSYGEKSYIEYILQKINYGSDFPNVESFFKIGARYYLNDEFDYNKYNIRTDVFKTYTNNNNETYCFSSLFKIDKKNIIKFSSFLEEHNIHREHSNHMEALMFKYINLINDYTVIDNLGLTQLIYNGSPEENV